MKILIAHNEAGNSRSIKSRLKKCGHEVIISKSFREAFQQVVQHHPDLIIADLAYSTSTFQMINEVKKRADKKTPILILSNLGQVDNKGIEIALNSTNISGRNFS